MTVLKEKSFSTQNQSGLGVRHLQAGYCFISIAVAFMQRLNLSVAVIKMTTSDNLRIELEPEKKAIVLSSLFFGYSFLQLYYGSLARRGYAVKLSSFGNFTSGVLSLILPMAALHFGWIGICVVRIITGLVQGVMYPCFNTIMVKWAIPQEKNVVMCLVFAGSSFGSLICVAASGYIGYCLDWPAIFYATGLVGVVWSIIYLWIGGETVESYKWISEKEREYIKQSFLEQNKQAEIKPTRIPWKKIFTSPPVIAVVATGWCANWSAWTMMTLTPSYISGVLDFDLESDGLTSSLPYLFSCVTAVLFSYLSSILKKKTSVSDRFQRLFWNSLAMYGTGSALLILALLPPSQDLAIALLVLSHCLVNATALGYNVNSLDLAPNFAGVIMSIICSTANTASIIGPLLSTYLVKDTTDYHQWKIVFQMSSATSFIGNTIFLIWGSTEKQAWNEVESQQEVEEGFASQQGEKPS